MSDIDDRYLYKPLNKYKPFARNIGIIDGPFEYLTILDVGLPLPFTTRMTVVKLKMAISFSTRLLRSTPRSLKPFNRWVPCSISYRPTSSTTRILGSGRGRFRML